MKKIIKDLKCYWFVFKHFVIFQFLLSMDIDFENKNETILVECWFNSIINDITTI